MNKKGISQDQLDWIKDLVFVALIALFFLAPQFKIKDNTLHNLNVEIRDYAITKDTASLAPGKLSYTYLANSNITISTGDNCVIKGETITGVKAEYKCSRINNKVQETFNKNKITLVKS